MASAHHSVQEMWETLRQKKDLEKNSFTSWHFADNKEAADELLQLVLNGEKRATASLHLLYQFIEEPLPRVGDFSVVTDWEGQASCIIEITRVEIIPFNEVSAEFARKEGEGDKSLSYWRREHRDFFSRDLEQTARLKFQEDMLVVCEEFVVVFPD